LSTSTLELLEKESSKLLTESQPSDYPVAVAAAWSLSMAQLKEQTPFAWELLRRCAFFDHIDVKDAVKRERIAIDFEPPPL